MGLFSHHPIMHNGTDWPQLHHGTINTILAPLTSKLVIRCSTNALLALAPLMFPLCSVHFP